MLDFSKANERATEDQCCFQDVLDTLSEIRITSDLQEVAEFISRVKPDSCFPAS